MDDRVSTLPTETWLDIVELATAPMPDPLLRPRRTHTFHTYYPCNRAYERHRHSQNVKLRLARVNKQLNALVTPMIWEHVTLSSEENLSKILEAVKLPLASAIGTDQQDDLADTTLGSLVKRLDVYMTERRYQPGLHPEGKIVKLVQALPDLRVLVFNTIGPKGGSKTLHFAKIIPKGLQTLYSISCFTLPIFELLAFLESHPSLSYLDAPCADSSSHDIDAAVSALERRGVTFPALRELVFNGLDPEKDWVKKIPSSMLPNLEHVTFTGIDRAAGDFTSQLEKFLESHGRNLTTISLKTFLLTPTNSFHIWLASIQKHCPRMRKLVVHSELIHAAGPVLEEPLPEVRGISTLGVGNFYNGFESTQSAQEDTLAGVVAMTKSLPDLQTIEFVDEGNVRALQSEGMQSIFAAFLKDCRTRRFNVLDSFGTLLNASS